MKFTRHAAGSGYFISEDSAATVYVHRDYTGREFELSQSFTQAFTDKFLLIFSYEKPDYNDRGTKAKLEEMLDGINPKQSKLVWIDNFKASDYLKARYIQITRHSEVYRLSISKGESYGKISLLKHASILAIAFDTATSRIILKHPSGNLLNLTANRGSASFGQMSIAVYKRDRYREGAVILEQGKFAEEAPIQAVSPYVVKNKIGKPRVDPVASVRYLDGADLKSKYLLDGVYFPYRVESEAEKTESQFNLVPLSRDPAAVNSNFIDKKGRRLVASDLSKIKLAVGRVVMPGIDSQYYLIPRKGSEVEFVLPDGSTQMLLGYSGTEALGKESVRRAAGSVRLKFKDSSKVLIDTEGNSIEELEDSSGLTCPSLPDATDYFLDSEKVSLFNNSNKRLTAAGGGSRKVDYSHIKAGGFASNAELYVIPTLSFPDDRDLLAIERVFATQRAAASVKRSARAGAGAYVTPQGFLKSGDSFEFIRRGARAGKARGPRTLDGSQQFTIVSNHKDFTLSVSRDEVFFVVTPEILRQAGNAASIDIFFGISDFVIDLIGYRDKLSESEGILIFKYSRKSFDTLLREPSQWSNYGVFTPSDPKALRDVVSNYLKDLKGEDYTYLNRIRTDENWNGIILLDVPLKKDGLPKTFTGLAASQNTKPGDSNAELGGLITKLRFQFVAFPINKTQIESGLISIKSTSFYGLIDYDLLENRDDFALVRDYYRRSPAKLRFALTKLLVRFDNSEITKFKSHSFILLPELFENEVTIHPLPLSHKDPPAGDGIRNLLRLDGNYQKNSAGAAEFNFAIRQNATANFNGSIIKQLSLTRASFTAVAGNAEKYRFDFDGGVQFGELVGKFNDLLSFKALNFQNIGFAFGLKTPGLILPDLSGLIALPEFDFKDRKGFLSSFPLKFNRFQLFGIKGFEVQDFDFFPFDLGDSTLRLPEIGSLFSLIFDFDLGTLGNLRALKGIKAELLLGWAKGRGLKLGFKFQLPSTKGINVDFGPFKLTVERFEVHRFKPGNTGQCTAYFVKLVDARLKLFGLDLPPTGKTFNGLLVANMAGATPKIGWLINYDDNESDKLVLGVGQRMGPTLDASVTTVKKAIENVRDVFRQDLSNYTDCDPLNLTYNEDRNWLIASEQFLPDNWAQVLDFSFIFNDPVLYGAHFALKGDTLRGLSVDVLYKKLSETLGVWSLELQLPNDLRTIDMGGGSLTIPNIGIEVYTDGGWKLDVGFPRGADFSRSCLIQIRPYIGWAGFYLSKLNSAELSLFRPGELPELPDNKKYSVIQASLAIRIGLGAYIEKGPFRAGASISVYGILEGAFAFKPGETGLARLFPDHFVLVGRMGAIVEVIGYVEFSVLKASVRIVLRQEYGIRLALISGRLRPVPLYIEGSVSVEVSFTLRCFKIFRRKICITIHLSFSATIRFQYTLGGDSPGDSALLRSASTKSLAASTIKIENITRVPFVYVPAVTKAKEGPNRPEELILVHNFAIPFFGVSVTNKDGKRRVMFSKKNLFRDIVLILFGELIVKLRDIGVDSRYESLRSVLLAGRHGDTAVEITFPNYRPWFILGHDIATSDALLRDVFKFDDGEISEFRRTSGRCDSPGSADCPFRVIPAPISPRIAVGTDPRDVLQSDNVDDFKLTVANLVKNESTEEVTLSVTHKENYSQTQIDYIDTFFDNYKTQFLERQKRGSLRKRDVPMYDLREKAIIPQFFKLLALLTLEAFYGELVGKNPNEPNPEITLAALESWDMSDHLEPLVGQINYFYNNGLRLPDRPRPAKTTAPIADILGQCSVFADKSGTPAKDATVTLAGRKAGQPTFDLTGEVFGTTDAEKRDFVGDFRKTIDDLKKLNLAGLGEQFEKSTSGPTDPFERRPVSLGVQNSLLRVTGTREKFFEMPRKIFQVDPLGHYRFRLCFGELAKPSETATAVTAKAAACANVEIKVRAYEVTARGGVRTALEIVNVSIDDLNLINRIRGDADFVNNAALSVYHRLGDAFTSIITSKATIVKTNLSTKTRPPLISEERLAVNPFAPAPTYVADSKSNMPEFVRLVWEGLTTNSGGYFILLDKTERVFAPDPAAQYTVVLSFELPKSVAEVSGTFTSFCNHLRVNDSAANIFGKLDENTHYLFMDLLTLADEAGTQRPVPVREYHPSIPAHCVGFKLDRSFDPASGESSQYLPLEFDLSVGGEAVVNRNEVLPLMPAEGERGGVALTYRHLTPLLKYKPEENVRLEVAPGVEINIYPNADRYKPVGQPCEFTFGVRDAYGFRAADFQIESLKAYKHKYFDKLVPIESWPLISFSYWLSNEASAPDEFKWRLTGTVSTDDLVPLIGLDPQKIGRDGSVIQSEMERVAGSVRSLLENLYTIAAQLADEKVTVRVSLHPSPEAVKRFLNGRVNQAIKCITDFVKKKNVKLPVATPTAALTVSQRCTHLLEQLAIEIEITRPEEHGVPLNGTGLWEHEAVTRTCSRVKLADISRKVTNRSWVRELARVVKEKVSAVGRFGLGISADEAGEKQVFIVDESIVKRVLPAQSMPLTTDSYFGIKPYSNQLWSGTYDLAQQGNRAERKSFTNVDLDSSLRIVLAKVDDLLTANEILGHPEPEALNELLASKKALAEGELSADKIANVNKPRLPPPNTDDFRNLLLDRLNNFYGYDGLIKLTVPPVPELAEYRLTVNIEPVRNYNIVSSKIGRQGGGAWSDEWVILFDQVDIEERIALTLNPQVTHLETKIDRPNGSDIESSKWIQLLDPVGLDPVVVSGGRDVPAAQKWFRINRVFPAKPVINLHAAVQGYVPAKKPEPWDKRNLGAWKYELGIEDQYEVGDVIEITLQTKSVGPAGLVEALSPAERFKGFIAYWAEQITQGGDFKREVFIDDLREVTRPRARAWEEVPPEESRYYFNLKKTAKRRRAGARRRGRRQETMVKLWEVDVPAGSELDRYSFQFPLVDDPDRPGSKLEDRSKPIVTISGFNLLDAAAQLISVLPEVKVHRNQAAGNEAFRYLTEKVRAATWATPHLQYLDVIEVGAGRTLDEVFREIPNLPFKATARYAVSVGKFEDATLPQVPVLLMEFNAGADKPTGLDKYFDTEFDPDNGRPCISLTIYNEDEGANDLPIFHAGQIKKR